MVLKSRSLMVLSPIAECRKAIEFLTEAGRLEATDVVLGGEPCPCGVSQDNEPQGLKGHRIVLLDGNTLVCRDCGKLFHTRHRALTERDRVVFEALNPSRPFSRPFGR